MHSRLIGTRRDTREHVWLWKYIIQRSRREDHQRYLPKLRNSPLIQNIKISQLSPAAVSNIFTFMRPLSERSGQSLLYNKLFYFSDDFHFLFTLLLLKHYATSQKVAGSIPNVVGFFH
jgi:hypothetical protein